MNTSDEESESVDDPGVPTPSSTPRVSLASRGQRDSISSSALGDEDIGHPAKRQGHFWCIWFLTCIFYKESNTSRSISSAKNNMVEIIDPVLR